MRLPPPITSMALLVGISLACSGLSTPEPTVDPQDPVHGMLARRDYAGAENALRQRIRTDRSNIDALVLLGDVNFLRGQDYRERWLENLGWARDQWMIAVRRDPSRCDAWRRLSVALVALSIREDLATPAGRFDQLPIAQGWAHCGGAALFGIETARPAETLLAPEAGEALARLELPALDWQPGEPARTPGPAFPFVVLDLPVQADGADRATPRTLTEPEVLTVAEAGARVVFLDRRSPGRATAEGLTLATSCPGTTWTLQGPDHYPVGRCTTRPFDARNGAVYDSARVVPTGTSHWEHATFPRARIDPRDILPGSVQCVGGPVGRLFVETPTCKVRYDRVIPQRRTLPASVGVAAHDDDHAEKIRQARSLDTFWGAEIATQLARGQVAIGMPHAWLQWALATPGACVGRGLYQRTELKGAHVELRCTAAGRDWTFRDMQLVAIDDP